MKRVCHLTSIHTRYDQRIFKKECRSLVTAGYDVTLLVNDMLGDEEIDGVKIISLRIAVKNKLERIRRISKALLQSALSLQADIYHIHDPELLLIARKLKKNRKTVIFDSHEDVPNDIRSKIWIPSFLRPVCAKAYEIFEKRILPDIDGVIGVTPHQMERLKKLNPRIVMVTNYPELQKKERAKPVFNKGKIACCFAGGIKEEWNHDVVLESLKEFPQGKYYLAGPVTEKYLTFLKGFSSWSQVEYKGRITHEEVLMLYENSTIGMALCWALQIDETGTLGNTKMFEFMQAGLPIICTNFPLWKEIVEEYQCGICVNPRSIQEVTEAVRRLTEDPDVARKMGENGKMAVQKSFNWTTQEKILLDFYETAI